MQGEMQALRSLLEAQATTIAKLSNTQASSQHTGNSSAADSARSPLQNLKPPPIPAYSGKEEERSSVRVKGFFYSIKTVGKLSKMSEENLLALAECHLQDKASRWIMRLEREGKKPITLDELQSEMLKEFVPSDEQTQAKSKLIKLKFKSNMEKHIATFQEYVQICDTPKSEAYLFFFMGLTPKYKEEFIKKYPTEDPSSVQEVYEYARTIDMSVTWGQEEKDTLTKPSPTASKNNDNSNLKVKRKALLQNKDAVSWGKAKKGEGDIYRKDDRCMKCGKKGWSDKSHPCRKDQVKREDQKN